MNRATFYLHFENKAKLFEAIIAEINVETARYWRLLGKTLAENSRAAVRAWLDTAFAWWEDNASILTAWHEPMVSDPVVAAGWKSMLDKMSIELEQYLEKLPDEQREDARLRIELLVVQLDQVCFRWRVQRVFEPDRERLLNLLMDMWCSVLKIDSP